MVVLGQDNLARAFLGQLQAVLSAKNEKFRQLGDLLGDFADGEFLKEFEMVKAEKTPDGPFAFED